MHQLAFSYEYNDEKSLDNFVIGKNQVLVDTLLKTDHNYMQTFIYAPKAHGKTHLLYAVADQLLRNQQGMYLSMKDADDFGEDMFEQTEFLDFIFIDDVDAIAGKRNWELILFAFINRAMSVDHCHVVFTANNLPRDLNLSLNDLRTRLEWGQVLFQNPLDSDELKNLVPIMLRAKGLDIGSEVIDFIYRRVEWNLPNVVKICKDLESYSIENNAKITIPVVKKVLGI